MIFIIFGFANYFYEVAIDQAKEPIISEQQQETAVFSYNISPLMEDRFIIFLKAYHRVYPLTEIEIRFIPEVYRFFILRGESFSPARKPDLSISEKTKCNRFFN